MTYFNSNFACRPGQRPAGTCLNRHLIIILVEVHGFHILAEHASREPCNVPVYLQCSMYQTARTSRQCNFCACIHNYYSLQAFASCRVELYCRSNFGAWFTSVIWSKLVLGVRPNIVTCSPCWAVCSSTQQYGILVRILGSCTSFRSCKKMLENVIKVSALY